ncbi:MAG: OmpA family protein [Bacteroidia bacterium]|nr:OmpA family protein [Bacteroidia bacterium]
MNKIKLGSIRISVAILIVVSISCSKTINNIADNHYKNLSYVKAIQYYEMLHEKDTLNNVVIERLADCHERLNDYKKAERWYSKLVVLPNVNSDNYLKYGRILMNNGKQQKAIQWLSNYQETNGSDPLVQNYLTSLKNYNKFGTNEHKYNIINLDINSTEDDFCPNLYNDKLLFSSSRINQELVKYQHSWNDKAFTKIYSSSIEGEMYNEPLLFNKSHQTKYHDGALSFSSDQSTIYFTRNNIVNGKVRKSRSNQVMLKIFEASLTGEQWTNEVEFPFNSDEYHCTHPTLSADGQFLYFSSDMPGGIGGMDIYYSQKINDAWTSPKNLGPNINTRENELFPHIDASGLLYFASEGHVGMGSLDIYLSTQTNNTWGKPINLGSPINSKYDDFGIFKTGTSEGYFCSNRSGGKGRDDIYYYQSKITPQQIIAQNSISENTKVSANVYDSNGNLQVSDIPVNINGDQKIKLSVELLNDQIKNEINSHKGTKIVITDINTNETKSVLIEDIENFDIALDEHSEYEYYLETEYFVSDKKVIKPSSKNDDRTFSINVEDLKSKCIHIDNIYYDFDKHNIRPDAEIVLKEVLKVVKADPSLQIVLESHTDSRQSNSYNDILSKKRSVSAKNYLVAKGIPENDIQIKYFGESKLLNNTSEENKIDENSHQANRRTEIFLQKK